jgi:outer membrane protein assembly factor BamD
MNSRIIFLALIILFLGSCSDFQKLLKSSDYDLKYEKALEYYAEEDYYRSLSLLEELVSLYRGTKKAEKIAYHYAYCHYHQRDYILAGYHFKNFSQTYPNSEFAEEAEFMSAYCFYLNSPKYTLDQTNTLRAIDAFQLFINKYPNSERKSEANELIEKLRAKLEIKSFENAKLYFDLEYYNAAIVSLQNSLKEFPDTEFREDLLYYILESQFLYAENSVSRKQKERYEKTVTFYYTLIDEYPNGKFIKDAEQIYDETVKHLNK